MATNEPIQPEQARNVLWWFGDRENGWEPGGFTDALIKAITKADSDNKIALSAAFPQLVVAVILAQEDPAGMNKLRAIAKGDG